MFKSENLRFIISHAMTGFTWDNESQYKDNGYLCLFKKLYVHYLIQTITSKKQTTSATRINTRRNEYGLFFTSCAFDGNLIPFACNPAFLDLKKHHLSGAASWASGSFSHNARTQPFWVFLGGFYVIILYTPEQSMCFNLLCSENEDESK